MPEELKPSSDPSELGHRAYVTLLFSDLCDYTALSEAIDPEEVAALRQQLDELANSIVTKYTGHVTQVYGDGSLCTFGFPQPGEDDVRRAIDAALELHAATRSAIWPSAPEGFEVRLHSGIHRGLVFVRQGAEIYGRFHLSGDAVNTAARLSGMAQRDEILVTAATISGSEQFFETEEVPPVWLRGKSAPHAAYRVTGRSHVRSRFEARSRRGLTTFVDRHTELGALLANLRRDRAARGRLLVVQGTAGIGKTRLLEEFSLRAERLGVRVLRGTCENYGELVPLEPFSQVIRQVFVDGGAANDQLGAAIERECRTLGAPVAAQLPTFRVLLALQPASADELSSTNVAQAIDALFEALTAQRPLALILDDWQWADGASRGVLGQLRDATLERGVCLIVGVRAAELLDPTLQPDQLIQVHPLSHSDCARFISALQPDSLALGGLSEIVVQRTGGNPLFLEELCRALPQMTLDERRMFEHSEMPTTVQSVIQTRIAALPPAELLLLRVAAVVGIEFGAPMLAELTGAPASEIATRVKSLIAEDLIYEGDTAETYRFKHGLMREVVYESVLIGERKQLHAHAARLIERSISAASDATPMAEALAYHYRGSGDLLRSAHHAEVAGDRAMAISALDRACHHYYAAMNALDALPPSRELRRKWLAICLKWGLPFAFSPVGVEGQLEVLHTAIDYASELDDLKSKARVWHWLGWAHYDFGNYSESIYYYRSALEQAQNLGDDRFITQLRAGLGQSQAAAGDYAAALENLTSAIESKRAVAHTGERRTGSVAMGYAYALACMAMVHADRGDFDLAHRVFEEALAAVSAYKHAIEGSILSLKTICLVWRGHWEEACATARLVQQNGQRFNSAFNFVCAGAYGAYAAWEISRSPEHLQRMRVTVEWIEAQHVELFAAGDYGWFAHMLQTHGEHAHAHAYVERALRRAEIGDPLGAAMAYRVLTRLGPAGDRAHVESCLEQATRAGEARGSRHEAVKTQLLRAEIGREYGDFAGAERWAEASRTTANELGMHSHAQRADALITALRSG